jgi:RNA polymerase sigma factor (TIGR02999 family)
MPSDVSRMLEKLRAGDESALNELVTVLYDELHRIASRHLRSERTAHTLQTTALVHEAYIKLLGDHQLGFADRVHFLAVASRIMRQVLVDYARARATKKRAGEGQSKLQQVTLTTRIQVQANAGVEQLKLLDLDSALDALACEDESLAKLIEMRYFGGMTAEETAEVLDLSVHVVRHDLRLAQSWLRRRLGR